MEKTFAATVSYNPDLIHDSLEQLFELVQNLKEMVLFTTLNCMRFQMLAFSCIRFLSEHLRKGILRSAFSIPTRISSLKFLRFNETAENIEDLIQEAYITIFQK